MNLVGGLLMWDIVDRRCHRCGNKYKYEDVLNVIAFCSRCRKIYVSKCEYGYGPITPCKIYLSEDIIGEVDVDSNGVYNLSVPMLKIFEKLESKDDPLTESENIVVKLIGKEFDFMYYRIGELMIHNEVFHKGYTFKQFKKSSLYKTQDDVKMFSLEGKYKLDKWDFYVSFLFKYGKLYMISLCCEDSEISFEDEPKRKALHDSILAEYGLSDNEKFSWGNVNSVYDRKSNISSINIIYNSDEVNQIELLKDKVKTVILNVITGLKDDVFLDLIMDQAIFECMKSTFDEEMKSTQKSMEKAFFPNLTDKNKTSSYDKTKQRIKRDLKVIEYYRNEDGQKLEQLSGIFPEELKRLKKSPDETRSNFNRRNQFNISDQAVLEVKNFEKFKIYKKILEKQITDVKKISNSNFEDYYKEYDEHYIGLIDSVSSDNVTPERYLSAVIDLFNIEDKLSLEWLYNFADYAVKNNITKEVFDRAKCLYVSHINLISGLTCMNRAFF